MTVERDPAGTAHIKGCFIWRIIRITRDVGLRANWIEEIQEEYSHLTYEDITEAFSYDGQHREEIELLLKHSYELDGTAHKQRECRAMRQRETLKALDIVREAVHKMKKAGAEPGAIYLSHPATWYLSLHGIAQALGEEFDVDAPDELFGVPVIRTGQRSFIISDLNDTRCIFLDTELVDPREMMGMGK